MLRHGHHCRVEARIKWDVDHPLRISDAVAVGRSRQGRLYNAVGPHSRRIRMQTRRQSRVSQSGCSHAQHSGQTDYRIHDTRMAIAPYGDRRCSSHLSHHFRSMYEEHKCIASPSPQFACPQRGRKRLSRGATLHTELALEWPDLVQIGRCKVQWLPSGIKKRILTSFS